VTVPGYIPVSRAPLAPLREASWFCFLDDLSDDGVGATLDEIGTRSGVGDVTVAAAYHSARDIFPHRRHGRVRFLPPGVIYFHPDERRYGRVRPTIDGSVGEQDTFALVCREAAEHGSKVSAWAVTLHNDRLGFEDPALSIENAFGDRLLTDLCPSNPDVRRYVVALMGDLARYPLAAIRAESLHFPSLLHGYHHERYLEPLDEATAFLLGLCFCEHCISDAVERDVNAGAIRAATQAWLDAQLRGPVPSDVTATPESLSAALGVDLAAYLQARQGRVTSLTRSAGQAAETGGVSLHFLDVTGAAAAFATGDAAPELAAQRGWMYGIDVAGIVGTGARLEVTAYGRAPGRLGAELACYKATAGADGAVGAVLRPGSPDCQSVAALGQNIRNVRLAGAESLHFYHYGLYRERSLDWVREAFAEHAEADTNGPSGQRLGKE
jgi:hypothetical protein